MSLRATESETVGSRLRLKICLLELDCEELQWRMRLDIAEQLSDTHESRGRSSFCERVHVKPRPLSKKWVSLSTAASSVHARTVVRR